MLSLKLFIFKELFNYNGVCRLVGAMMGIYLPFHQKQKNLLSYHMTKQLQTAINVVLFFLLKFFESQHFFIINKQVF